VQFLEDYSCHLLFGLRHPSALYLYEQKAMQMVLQDLIDIHGNKAFSEAFADFLNESGKVDILYQVNDLMKHV
jgi:hypothetical protein